MTTFSEEHQKRIRALDGRAQAAGTNMTQVCKNTGIARATYERWLQRPPQSITKLDELEAEVARAEAAAAQAQAENAAG